MAYSSAKKLGLFGLFDKKNDPDERLPSEKLPVPNVEIPEQPDQRAVSGQRVICACSMQLPRVDRFNHLKVHSRGYLIFNTRGGALYLSPQVKESQIPELFNPGEPGTIRNFKLYPKDKPEVEIGHITARFLFFTDTQPMPGMVLRFGGLKTKQLDLLNAAMQYLPKTGPDEYGVILKTLRRRPKQGM